MSQPFDDAPDQPEGNASEPDLTPALDDANKDTGKAAADQAKDNDGIFAPTTLRFDDGSSIEVPPNPAWRLLDDDRLEEYDELMFEAESYDRGPDIFIPEQEFDDKAGNRIKLAAETKQGNLLTPYRKTDAGGVTKLIKPPHEVRVVKAALGPQQYEKLRNGLIDGRRGCAADIWKLWNAAGIELAERQRDDSKSDAGASILEALPEADSK